MLKSLDSSFRDGENNPVKADATYRISETGLANTISQIYQKHGTEACLLPLSAISAAGKVFQQPAVNHQPVIGLLIGTAPHPKIRTGSVSDLASISLDEIVIDHENMEICAGAKITIDQLNRSLADSLSAACRVPGSDLTSYAYAQVGSTFMTGGMGPQRRYFSDSVTEILLHNGDALELVDSQHLRSFAGTYGWSGVVAAVRCRYAKLPENEIAFALPIHNDSSDIAQLLGHLAKYCFFDFGEDMTSNSLGEPDVIIGLEHVTVASMGPLIHDSPDNTYAKQARRLSEKCMSGDADGALFVNGCSNLDQEEFLALLIDDMQSPAMTIGGIELESAEIFRSADEMRELREAIPYAARMHEPTGKYRYKNHTDANIRLHSRSAADCAAALWDINQCYVQEVEQYIEKTRGLRGDVLVYGHMNPYGLDPHNRLTLAADRLQDIATASEYVNALRLEFYRRLGEMCAQTGSEMIGGEKGADSEHAILQAFGGPETAPENLRNKYCKQVQAISSATQNLNWRAFDLYRTSL